METISNTRTRPRGRDPRAARGHSGAPSTGCPVLACSAGLSFELDGADVVVQVQDRRDRGSESVGRRAAARRIELPPSEVCLDLTVRPQRVQAALVERWMSRYNETRVRRQPSGSCDRANRRSARRPVQACVEGAGSKHRESLARLRTEIGQRRTEARRRRVASVLGPRRMPVTKLPELGPAGDQAFLRSTKRPSALGKPKLRIVDLFSGCGGMTLGAVEAARSLGFDVEIVLAMELDKEIRAIYDANFETTITALRDDVATRFDGAVGKSLTLLERMTIRDVGEVDLLLGGPPCQGHSNLNNHTRRNDPKNALYLRMLRAVEVLKPRAVIIENVPDIRHATNHAVKRATNRLEALDYFVIDTVIAAAELGVPQRRTRHVLVAVKGPSMLSASDFETRSKDNPRNLRWAIGDLEDEVGEHIFRFSSKLSPENEARAKYLLRYDQYDLPNKRRPECHRDKPELDLRSRGRCSERRPTLRPDLCSGVVASAGASLPTSGAARSPASARRSRLPRRAPAPARRSRAAQPAPAPDRRPRVSRRSSAPA